MENRREDKRWWIEKAETSVKKQNPPRPQKIKNINTTWEITQRKQCTPILEDTLYCLTPILQWYKEDICLWVPTSMESKVDFRAHGESDLVTSGCYFTAVLLISPLKRVYEWWCVRVRLCIYPWPLKAWDLKQKCSRAVCNKGDYLLLPQDFQPYHSSLISILNKIARGHVSSLTIHYFSLLQ